MGKTYRTNFNDTEQNRKQESKKYKDDYDNDFRNTYSSQNNQKMYSQNQNNDIRNDNYYESNNYDSTNKNPNYTHTNFYKNNDDFNIQVSNLKKKVENNQKIKGYKNRMNKELLDILQEERQKEEIRRRKLEELENNTQERDNLEKQFREERLKSRMMIAKKTDEIKQKVKDYEDELNNEIY